MNRLIRCVVKDKHALQVMDYLEDFAVEPPAMTRAQERLNSSSGPIPPPISPKPVTKQSHNGASLHVNTFVENARQAGLKTITGKQLVQHMKMGGFHAYAYNYRLTQLLKDKSLKRTRQQGVYEVV